MSNPEANSSDHRLMLDVILAARTDNPEEDYAEVSTGEFGKVLVGKTRVIKMPGDGRDSESRKQAIFESEIINTINRSTTLAPLEIPQVVSAESTEPPYHMVFRKVDGEVIDQQTLLRFNASELQNYGVSIGSFVSWMEDAMTIEQYSELYAASGSPQIFDRSDHVQFLAEQADTLEIPSNLKKLLLEIRDDLTQRTLDGDISPNIVGHDDLWVGNLTFGSQMHGRPLKGVFDFGLTKPSSPERELRALAPFPDALEAGIDAYERSKGRRLSRDLIGFWAIAQVATNYAGMLRFGNVSGARSKQKDLQVLLPNKDWSE